jgi:haloalkane dehalogenase
MHAYRAPHREREARLPTLVWPRELPIDGVPDDVVAIVEQYGAWVASSDYAKLLISAQPGSIGRPRISPLPNVAQPARGSVKGIHFVQEDSPDEIGTALRNFVARLT